MSIDRRLLTGALGLVLTVAACGGGSASPAASPAASSAPAAASAEAPASSAPAPSAPAPSEAAATTDTGPDVSFAAGAAAELEGKLPSSVNGIALTKTSVSGDKINTLGTDFDTSELAKDLKSFGKSLSDVRAAQAQSDSSAGLDKLILLFAVQIQGVDASKFQPLLSANMDNLTDATVNGKAVKKSPGPPTSYVYASGDTVYIVLAGTDANADAALGALP